MGLLETSVVVVPVFEELLRPSTPAIISAPVLLMSTAPAVLAYAKLEAAV
jgi:hypothetical protein